MSSCTPSAKNAFSLSVLKFSKGRTAMLFSGIAGVARAGGVGLAAALVCCGMDRCKKNRAATRTATINTNTTAITAQWLRLGLVAVTVTGAVVASFGSTSFLNFLGTAELP